MEDRAFELIVKEYKQMVYVYVVAMVRDPSLAEDIAQETFLAAYAELQKDKEIRSLPAWLRGIARNVAAKVVARRRREQPAVVAHPEAIERVIAPFDRFELGDLWEDRLQALRRCRDSLPDHQQRALRLHYEKNLTVPAITRQTGWLPATVYQLLWSARKFLRECIGRRISHGVQAT